MFVFCWYANMVVTGLLCMPYGQPNNKRRFYFLFRFSLYFLTSQRANHFAISPYSFVFVRPFGYSVLAGIQTANNKLKNYCIFRFRLKRFSLVLAFLKFFTFLFRFRWYL